MDSVTMTFYAVICGGLAAVAPAFGSRLARGAFGIAVGAVAAIILPFMRRAFGI